MPKKMNAEDRRVVVSIKTKYLTNAGRTGHKDLESYIDALEDNIFRSESQHKAQLAQKDNQFNEIKKALEDANAEITRLKGAPSPSATPPNPP